MAKVDDRSNKTRAWRNRPHRLRLECRECDVICERVVYPWRCLRSGCEYVYSYEDSETVYFGCLYKVFSAEFDLAAFSDGSPAGPPAKGRRGRRRSLKAGDPYGPVRVMRSPQPQCDVTVEQAYDCLAVAGDCCNPTFFHHPFGTAGDSIRLTAMMPEDQEDPQG